MTTTSEQYRVEQAIEDSIRESRIVDLSARLDSAEWVELARALEAAAENWTEVPAGNYGDSPLTREYWGDEDGDEWRVYLVAQ